MLTYDIKTDVGEVHMVDWVSYSDGTDRLGELCNIVICTILVRTFCLDPRLLCLWSCHFGTYL